MFVGWKSGAGMTYEHMMIRPCSLHIHLLQFLVSEFAPGAGIDLSSLCIVRGKVCWDLYIDGLVVSSDGNVLDALGAAIKV